MIELLLLDKSFVLLGYSVYTSIIKNVYSLHIIYIYFNFRELSNIDEKIIIELLYFCFR